MSGRTGVHDAVADKEHIQALNPNLMLPGQAVVACQGAVLVVMMWCPMKSASVGVNGSRNRKLSVSM